MTAYYAVAKGKTVGIFSTWEECQAQVKNFKGAIYKKFTNRGEAEQFIRDKTGLPFAAASGSAQTNEPEPKKIKSEVPVVAPGMGNQIRTGIGRTAQMISPMPLNRVNPVSSRPAVAKVKISFDLRRELHDAQREMVSLRGHSNKNVTLKRRWELGKGGLTLFYKNLSFFLKQCFYGFWK